MGHNSFVPIPFLDRQPELSRLNRAFAGPSALVVLYGRRRLGKSRLLREVLHHRLHIYYVGDARDAALQRQALAREAARHLPGFADVLYPDWERLLQRLWHELPAGAVVAIDELPDLVARSPELPSLLRKLVDQAGADSPHLALAGSSQRMMHGMVLDASAPLYGRAQEIIRVEPLPAGWLAPALKLRSPVAAVEHHAAWGGVPRYWELAEGFPSAGQAFRSLVLDPLGVLHREPDRLLADDLADSTRASSILALVGQGCHRLSEIAGRLGLPATSLAHPLARLVDLGLLQRAVPFGRSPRDTKRTYYLIGDPFLRAWYRFVEPNRSRLEAGLLDVVSAEVAKGWPHLCGIEWENLARASVPRLRLGKHRFEPASRWWGRDREGRGLELDVVASAIDDPDCVLVGEAKSTCTGREARELLAQLARKAAACPALEGKHIQITLWVLRRRGSFDDERVVDVQQVLEALR